MRISSRYEGKISELEKLAMELKFDKLPEDLKNNWKAAIRMYPGESLFFLKDDFIDDMMEKFSFISEFREMFKKAAKIARYDKKISLIAWLWYYMVYIVGDWSNIYSWPNLAYALGELESMIPILVLFAGYDKMIEFYEQRGIPEEVRTSNYYGIESSFSRFKKEHDSPGVGNRVFAWSVRYFGGTLFYLGRLQYELINNRNKILVYRSRSTGETICLAEDGQVFRGDGQYDGTNGIEDEKDAWTSEYKEYNGLIQAFPLSPESYAINKKVYLDKEEWELILQRGDPILNIHIPGGRKLDYDAVRESFLSTIPFFDTYFPEFKWEALVCNSWLLDTQLRQFLKTDSNILKFQDCFYLFPVLSIASTGIYRFLFQSDICEPEKLPADSSLQKNVRDYMIEGGRIKTGGGFILKEDIHKQQGHYRETFGDLIEKYGSDLKI